MKETLTPQEALSKLLQDRNAGWSYAGAKALVEYLEELESGIGEEIELDVVALRCEFTEYSSALEAVQDYDYEPDESLSEEEQEEAAREWLEERTTVIPFAGGIIVQEL